MTESAKTEAEVTIDEMRKKGEDMKSEVRAIANLMLDAIPEGTSHAIVLSAVMTACLSVCTTIEMPPRLFLETMKSLVDEAEAIERMNIDEVSATVGTSNGMPEYAVDRLREGLDPALMKTLLYLAMKMRDEGREKTHSIAMIMVKGAAGTARIVSYEEVAGGAIGKLLSPENLALVKEDVTPKTGSVRVIAVTESGAGICSLSIERLEKVGTVL